MGADEQPGGAVSGRVIRPFPEMGQISTQVSGIDSTYWNQFFWQTAYTGGTGSAKWFNMWPGTSAKTLKVTITGPSYTYTHTNLDLYVYQRINNNDVFAGQSAKSMTSNEAVTVRAPANSLYRVKVYAQYIGSYQSRPAYAREFTIRMYSLVTN